VPNKKSVVLSVVFSILFFVFAFFGFGLIWVCDVWRTITFDEIVYHLMAPMEGTEKSVIIGFILRVPLIAAVLTAVLVFVSRKLLKKSKADFYSSNAVAIIASLILLGVMTIRADEQYGIRQYIRAQSGESSFMNQYYADPSLVELRAPEQKRNLIYIFLESMEMTYADESVGGAFQNNVIPELTNLALVEGECFNGASESLDGGIVLSGASWTMGGLVAQTGGVPIVTGLNNRMATESDSFYPNLISIGDVLEEEGYRNYFMCGSDSVFGGRAQYFIDHGNYEIFDYNTALEERYIPEGYEEWWGYEDEKLFTYAREKILELAGGDQPFNFTMLTADTHFEDGYVCRLCEDEYDTQYSNVMACSSRQLMEFINWLKEQDFYENTTIVLSGDHLTMDADYCEDLGFYERRTYVSVINSALDYEAQTGRYYDTFDLFPTTLAAMGFEIEGDRLGLGVNLYGSEPTLVEQFSASEINEELMMSGDYYTAHFGTPSPFSGSMLRAVGLVEVDTFVDNGNLQVEVIGLENADEMPSNVYGYILNPEGEIIDQADLVLGTDKIYRYNCSGVDTSGDYTLCIYVTDADGNDVGLFNEPIEENTVIPEDEYGDVDFIFERNGEETARIVYPLLMPSGTVPGWIYVWDDNDPTNIRKYPLSYLRVTNDDGSESIFITSEDVYVADFDPELVNFSIYFYHDDYGVLYSNRYMHSLS